jgi:hypothetical protein
VYGLFDSGDWNKTKYIGAASWLGRPLQHAKQAQDLKNRTRKHHGIRKVQRGGRHIGWKVLEVCDSWKETLATETRLIFEYKTKFGKRPDWNLSDGGQGCVGYVHTPEARLRISSANIGKVYSLETRKKLSESVSGFRHSSQAKSKISASLVGNTRNSGRSPSLETRMKLSSSQFGRHHTMDSRIKMQKRALGNKSWTGKKHTPETRLLMSIAAKSAWARLRSERVAL